MVKIIKYITGIPLDTKPVKRFEDAMTEYGLTEERDVVLGYSGRLTLEDFTALEGVLCSNEYLDLKGLKPLTSTNIEDFLSRVITSRSGDIRLKAQYHEKDLLSITKTSESFLPTLEELLNHKDAPLSYNDAERHLLDAAKKNGLFIPISFVYPYDGIEELTYDRKTLVYVDDSLLGKVTLRIIEKYFDQWGGDMTNGVATIEIGKRHATLDWDSWRAFGFVRFDVDINIRKKILKEKVITHGGIRLI